MKFLQNRFLSNVANLSPQSDRESLQKEEEVPLNRNLNEPKEKSFCRLKIKLLFQTSPSSKIIEKNTIYILCFSDFKQY